MGRPWPLWCLLLVCATAGASKASAADSGSDFPLCASQQDELDATSAVQHCVTRAKQSYDKYVTHKWLDQAQSVN